MSNKTNIEDIHILMQIRNIFEHLKNYGWINDKKREIKPDTAIQAIENILADRNNIASKYNNLIYKIEEKIKENKEYLQHANTMYEYTEKDVINATIEILKEILNIEQEES